MNRTRIQLLLGYVLNLPPLTGVLIGFFISYLYFFVGPIFLTSQVMQFFIYVPVVDPIGIDLKQILDFSHSWVTGQTPYIGTNIYPPLQSVLFTPLLLVNFSLAYKIITIISVFCYIWMTFIFPLLTKKESQVSLLLMLVFITGLFSYGFQFELERGQFNVITVFICFLAIWIYHYHHRYRYLAYILFSVSVQLKIYPLIFIIMFNNNWRDWRSNIKRFLILTTLNFTFFFVLGPSVFIDFIKAMMRVHSENSSIWIGNHSIRSFVALASKLASEHSWTWENQYSGLAQLAILTIIAGCIFLIMIQEYRQKQNGMNSYLLLCCTIGSLLIPSISHDYKLSILSAPVAILLVSNRFSNRVDNPHLHLIFFVLTIIFSTAYSSTLFSFTNKPLILDNNLPALVTMMLAITCFYLVSHPRVER